MAQSKAPREGHVQVAGKMWLARMIDKARLDAAGEIEQFDLEYPCPMDQGLLHQLGIGAPDFQQIVVQAATDEEIVAELKKRNILTV